jgi:hypothetical protein
VSGTVQAVPVKIDFILSTYDNDKPWIVLATGRDSVELTTVNEFWPWVQVTWPAPRFGVRVEPGQGVPPG